MTGKSLPYTYSLPWLEQIEYIFICRSSRIAFVINEVKKASIKATAMTSSVTATAKPTALNDSSGPGGGGETGSSVLSRLRGHLSRR